MSKVVFDKPFTQQESIPEAGIENAVEILRTGGLHRYGSVEGGTAGASLLERGFANYSGQR